MGNKAILRKPSPEKIREAVVLIAGGRRTAAEMASQVGCSERTLERALKAYRDGLASAPPPPPPAADPAAPAAAPPEDSEIDRARRAAGLDPKPADKTVPITRQEVDLAAAADRKRREDYCVDQIRQAKGLLVYGAGVMMLSIPMDDKRLVEACELRPLSEDAIRASSADLEPHLRKYCQGGLWGVAIAMLFDLKSSWDTLADLSREHQARRQAAREKAAKKPEASS